MAAEVEIKCNKKNNHTDPHECIQDVGGVNPGETRWHLPLDQAIASIETGKRRISTNGGGKPVWVIIGKHNSHKYLKKEEDGIHPNNLVSLPECP